MSTYLGSGNSDLHRRDYRPAWLDDLAEDATMDASVLNGIVEGADAVRAILAYARTLYDYQEFNYVGEYGEHGFVEDYTSRVHGESIGSIVVVRYNDAGRAQHVIINHRPLRSVLLWSRLMAEHFANTPYAKYFISPELTRELLEPDAAS